jgi:glycosyltransferase involved in cell wall biosynthesis
MHAIIRQLRASDEGIGRIFLDLTTSLDLAEAPPMGILRVECEIAWRLLACPDLKTVPVVFRHDGVVLALSPDDVTRIFAARSKAASREVRLHIARETTARPNIAPSVPTDQPSTGLGMRTRAGLRRVARAGLARMPAPMREDMRAILLHSRQLLRTAVTRGTRPSAARTCRSEILPTLRMVVHPGPGDVLWTAGLYSNCVPLRTVAELRARTGLRVVATCLDLIRVTHPQFNPQNMAPELFQGDAVALLDAADLVLAISEASRRDLLAFAERTGRAAPPIQVLQLGIDFAARQVRSAADLPAVPHDFPPRRFALAVGTVEPRKNYALLVRVWERLAADPAFPLDLVIVGGPGYGADESVALIERSSLFGSRILWLESCPDAMLYRLYQTCHFVLCPSFAEGWGLPVAEALSLGRHVIASNRGAMPETGQGLAKLLDPEDEASWLAAIAEAAAAPRRTVAPANSPSWDAAAASVAEALRPLMKTDRAA